MQIASSLGYSLPQAITQATRELLTLSGFEGSRKIRFL